jgi:acyl carrier protein phosphodiesterase
MNYLAHIHLAYQSQTSLEGNFLGDFVKGAALDHLPESIANGVRLHRQIDTFTDQHAAVLQLKSQFPRSLRRFSGISLDIYFDHLLTQHWTTFCATPLDAVLEDFYQQIESSELRVSERYQQVRARLLNYRWLADYQHSQSVYRALQATEQRFRREIRYAKASYEFLQESHESIEGMFLTFYPELVKFVHSIVTTQESNHVRE